MKTLTKQSQRYFLFFYVIILLGLVKSPSPDNEISYNSAINTSFLPNEFPEYISYINLLSDSGKTDFLNLKHIISYLSFPEQLALFKSYKRGGTNKLFDFSIYQQMMKNNNVFAQETKAIADYISEYEKTLSYGLGCLKAVTNQYKGDSKYNEEMVNIVHSSIEQILDAQNMINQCQVVFLNTLQNIMIGRRNLLFELTSTTDPVIINNHFYKKGDDIVGINYSATDKTNIVQAYKEFAQCQNHFTSVLASNAMKAQIAITNMDGCKDYENPNAFAGNSSDIIKNPKINYRGNGDIKGINDGHLVRSDQKTMNGYYLNHGFGFGKAQRNNPHNFTTDDMKNIINNYRTTDVDFKSKLNDMKEGGNQPFGGLTDLLINSVFDGQINFDLTCQTSPQTLTITHSNNNNYNVKNNAVNPLPIAANTIISENFGFNINGYSLILICDANKKLSAFSSAVRSTTSETVYDFIDGDKNLGKTTLNTIQSCFGVFSAGGKDDKDACRDVITKDCGVDLDYKCKKSGLYDYIIAHPASVSLPYNCTVPDSFSCIEYITKYFIGGSVIVKPSAFIGYNLYASSTLNSESPFIEPQFYATPQRDSTSPVNTLNPQNSFSILYTTATERDDTAYKSLIIDKSAYKLINDSGLYLKYKKSLLMLIIIFTLI